MKIKKNTYYKEQYRETYSIFKTNDTDVLEVAMFSRVTNGLLVFPRATAIFSIKHWEKVGDARLIKEMTEEEAFLELM